MQKNIDKILKNKEQFVQFLEKFICGKNYIYLMCYNENLDVFFHDKDLNKNHLLHFHDTRQGIILNDSEIKEIILNSKKVLCSGWTSISKSNGDHVFQTNKNTSDVIHVQNKKRFQGLEQLCLDIFPDFFLKNFIDVLELAKLYIVINNYICACVQCEPQKDYDCLNYIYVDTLFDKLSQYHH